MKTTIGNILKLIRRGQRNPEIQEVALETIRLAGIASTDYPNIIKAVAEFVRENVKFLEDPGIDEVFGAPETLARGYSDCEDQSVLVASLLRSPEINLPVKLVVVSKTGELWDHVFLRAGYPPDNPIHWISVDTTIFPPSGREIPYVDQKVYEVD